MRKISLFLSLAALLLCACGPETARTLAVSPDDSPGEVLDKAVRVVPTPQQIHAMDNAFIAFVHFGPNTFTGVEWGSGIEDPAVFDLKSPDTDQWCAIFKDAGMKRVILTAKHHDGFVLWPSRYTTHGVASSPFRGDVVKELAASCRRYGLEFGFYLSPADLYQMEAPDGLYGNGSRATLRTIPRPVAGRPFADPRTFSFEVDDYNEYFLNQLFELLTEYGPVSEVWFDGAHPKRKGGQQYNYLAWKELIHALAPNAVVFGKEDLRWCGNEAGETREAEWNVIPGATWWSSLAIAIEAGLLLGAAYKFSGNLWFPIGIHWIWNYVQGHILGFAVSGIPVSSKLFSPIVSGPDIVTGGSFGAEASVIAVGVGLILAVILLLLAPEDRRK